METHKKGEIKMKKILLCSMILGVLLTSCIENESVRHPVEKLEEINTKVKEITQNIKQEVPQEIDITGTPVVLPPVINFQGTQDTWSISAADYTKMSKQELRDFMLCVVFANRRGINSRIVQALCEQMLPKWSKNQVEK